MTIANDGELISPALYSALLPVDEDERTAVLSVFLAVLHHGLANLADRSTPASVNTVLSTSDRIKRYLTATEAPGLSGH